MAGILSLVFSSFCFVFDQERLCLLGKILIVLGMGFIDWANILWKLLANLVLKVFHLQDLYSKAQFSFA